MDPNRILPALVTAITLVAACAGVAGIKATATVVTANSGRTRYSLIEGPFAERPDTQLDGGAARAVQHSSVTGVA